MRTSRIAGVMALLFSLAAGMTTKAQTVGSVDALANGFGNVPAEARMRMFWRVFGPAWEPGEIDYQFRLMKAAGIGGILTFFFYPVALDNPQAGIHNDKLGSPEFLKMLGLAAQKAKDTGLRFSVAGGSGWP